MNVKKTVAIVAAAGALTALAIPAMAETSLYGSVRLATFWNTVDSANATLGTNTDFEETLHHNSRLGVNFSADKLGGKIEFGVAPSGLSARHVYGTYKFDAGTLLVGQTENPYYLYSASVSKNDGVSNSYGALWDGRLAQIKFTMNNGLYFAAITPSTSTTAGTTENFLPKMNVGYEGKAGNFAYGAGIVGQTYDIQSATTGATGDTVTSLLGYFHGKLTAGAAAMQFNLGLGQNIGNMGFTNGNGAGAAMTNVYAFGEDTTTFEGYVQGSYTLSPMLKLNGGFGYVTDDNDKFDKADNRMQLFVNTNITVAKGFTITPEFSLIDQLDNSSTTVANAKSTNGDREYLVGAKWQMDF